mmetsp:Transcript_13380/g.50087  ORF Transcript_13380/g.50087 Transcript_13380/m.50087 type:complete len:306 (+) Transcript_13380:537-1454(+)
MCSAPYRSATRVAPGACVAKRKHSIAFSFLMVTRIGTSLPPPTAPFACALTIICAKASLRTDSIWPLARESSIAPNTGAGRPPPHTQSSNNRCASGHGTHQHRYRMSCFTGPPPARPRAAMTNASTAGGSGPVAFSAPPLSPTPSRSRSETIFAPIPGISLVGVCSARRDPSAVSPASTCSLSSCCFGMSATYQFAPVKSSASSCGTKPCTLAKFRASSVGDSLFASRGRKLFCFFWNVSSVDDEESLLKDSSFSSSENTPGKNSSDAHGITPQSSPRRRRFERLGGRPGVKFSSPVISSNSTTS